MLLRTTHPHCQKNETLRDSSILAALETLATAYNCSCDVECDVWQFAIEIRKFYALGVTDSVLRWLVMKGYVGQALETTRPIDPTRKFKLARNLAFTEKTCFVITEAGLSFLENKCDGHNTFHFPKVAAAAKVENIPRWDSETRTLFVGQTVVKQYRVPSPNQEAILAAFQEEGWPKYISDPLSPVAQQHPKQRLRDTIRWLNTNQKNTLIRFRGDGTGERICWELIDKGALPIPFSQGKLRHVS